MSQEITDSEALARAWPSYFSKVEVEFNLMDPRVVVSRAFVTLFQKEKRLLLRGIDLASDTVIALNYNDLLEKCPMGDFAETLRDEPEDMLACMGLALCVLRARQTGFPSDRKITIRIHNVEPLLPLRNLKSSVVGQFVAIRGNVIRVSAMRPLVTSMMFKCSKCGTSMEVYFEDGMYEPPSTCAAKSCRSRHFVPDRSTATARDWQRLKLQEFDADSLDPGRVPRTVEVELTDDLVDTVVPGDTVAIAGIVKAVNQEVAQGRGLARARSLYNLYVDAISITTGKTTENDKSQHTTFSVKELKAVQTIANSPNLFPLIVASLCPSIFGHEMVKAGLALGLFGGTPPASETDGLQSSRAANGT